MRDIVKACRRPLRFAHCRFACATGTAISQGFRTASRMACDVPHRYATRSWPKTLGNRLYGSLSTRFGITASIIESTDGEYIGFPDDDTMPGCRHKGANHGIWRHSNKSRARNCDPPARTVEFQYVHRGYTLERSRICRGCSRWFIPRSVDNDPWRRFPKAFGQERVAWRCGTSGALRPISKPWAARKPWEAAVPVAQANRQWAIR